MTQSKEFQLYELLNDRRSGISKSNVEQQLAISDSTFKRALRTLRENHGVTILPPRNGGYKLDEQDRGRFLQGGQLLSKSELLVLVQSYKLFNQFAKDPYHEAQLTPILEKVSSLMGTKEHRVIEYIDTLTSMERQGGNDNFKTLSESLESQIRVKVNYKARSNANSNTSSNVSDTKQEQRELSPQKLLRYKDNWYLIAWCHTRQALRSFSIERFQVINKTQEKAYLLPTIDITKYYSSTYGIFGGNKTEEAIILFSKEISEWIKDEVWHKDQTIEQADSGEVTLTIPIGKDITELVMDLMRYGQHVKIKSPQRLRDKLVSNFKQSLENLGS